MEKKPKNKTNSFIRIKGNTIENKFFNVTFFPETLLIQVTKNGKRICVGNELVIEEEIGDLYYHKETLGIPLKTESGEGIKYGSFRVKYFYIDKSPLRRVMHVETDYFSLRWPYRLTDRFKPLIWRHQFLSFKKTISIYRDIPRIDFVTTVQNNHPRIRLRVRFDTDIKNPEYVCESQFGVVTRKTNQYYLKPEDWKEQPIGTFPSLRWIDYSDGEKGLTVINQGTSENEVRDESIYITLLRSVDMLSSDGTSGPTIPVPDARELGRHVFRYSIYPHLGDWSTAKSFKQGHEFNYNLNALQMPRTKKYRSNRSFLKIEPDNVLLTGLKQAEDGEGMIIRFYEASGKEAQAIITLFAKPKNVAAVNMIEEADEEFNKKFKLTENKIKIKVKPFEVITLKVQF